MKPSSLRLLCGLPLALVVTLGPACSLIEVKQDAFPPLVVESERPAPKPPRVVLTDSSIEIKEKVMFEFGSAEILPQSHGLLNEVAAVLRDNPQIELLQVEGHTDSVGGAAKNKQLSNSRAKAVAEFLQKAGVKKARLKPKGFGLEKPLVSNDTDEGREQNRRVEFNILKQGKKEVLVQDED